jgi:two-component system sensor histidine kinase DesK
MLSGDLSENRGVAHMSTWNAGDPAARRLQLLTLAYLLMYPVPWLQRRPELASVAASAAGIAVFLPLYFRSYGAALRTRFAHALGMLCIGFALYRCGGIWTVFAVYAAATLGFARPGRYAAIGVAGVIILLTSFGLGVGISPWEWGSGVFFSTVIGVGATFAGAINARNAALAAAREESRHLAVIAERERIARDLHDVLGHTLTVVAVKADLARKLIERDPAAAGREIEEIHATARAALAEVRIAVNGMRSTTLAQELAAARSALESAGIVVTSEMTTEPLPPLVETALAYVIREAATNVLRHSGARRCRITLAREGAEAALEVHDDGQGGSIVEGHGVTGMRQRLMAVRGDLELREGSGLHLFARAPIGELVT